MGKLCVVITGPSLSEAEGQIVEALQFADLLEFRLDLFDAEAMEQHVSLYRKATCPVIFTLKGEVLKLLDKLDACPRYFDMDFQEKSSVFEALREKFPKAKVVCSYHDFEKTPSDLEGLLLNMRTREAAIYKIATHATSPLDSLRVLDFAKNQNNLIALCMGIHGQMTRILAPVSGALWTYAPLKMNQSTAAGQLSAEELVSIYRVKELNRKTLCFGLLGGELVSKSVGHKVHNHTLKQLNTNAVYVKIALEKKEVDSFLKQALAMGFNGFSVTLPLKEEVLPARGAINTLSKAERAFIGSNTDGAGALDAIEAHLIVKGKKMVIIGAGGAARACASEAISRGASVTILNRTLLRAKDLAHEMGCGFGELDEIAKIPYDILVHATPHGMQQESDSVVEPKWLRPRAVVLEMIIRPKQTPLLRAAKQRGCVVIEGEEMFINQAVGQYERWFGSGVNKEEVREHVKASFCG